ncbi:MAG: hypothetical protein INR63_24065, partial [Actinomycetospora chiangmaiensis]|nr:hypothetical protein [Actinomycetospora chiangmaiensis]
MAGLVLLGGSATAAGASSFVSVEAPREAVSASFVVIGEPAPAPGMQAARAPEKPAPPRSPLDLPPLASADEDIHRISASIVALGEPDVEEVEVASIGAPPERKADPFRMPMVIRGGVVGDAAPAAASAATIRPRSGFNTMLSPSSGLLIGRLVASPGGHPGKAFTGHLPHLNP